MAKATKISRLKVLSACPKCGCPDVHLDSSSSAEASWIECEGCDNRYQQRCDEETLAVRWNKLNRDAMPEYNDGTEEADRG